MTELYNLRDDGDEYRISKFIDGNIEASYLLSHAECTCPAGSRPTCRHRQMLPEMLRRNLCNSALFWDFAQGFSCDINGNAKRDTVAEGSPAEPEIRAPGDVYTEKDFMLDMFAKDITPAPGHTDLMVSPESIDAYMEQNPLPAPSAPWRRI